MMANEKQLKTFTYGTVSHMPPELLKEGLLSPATDVYSYGMLLWEMLEGSHPYPNKNHGEIILGVTKGIRPKIPDSFPPDYAQLVEDCWHQDYEQRPALLDIIRRLKDMFVNCNDTKEALVKMQNILQTKILESMQFTTSAPEAQTKWHNPFYDNPENSDRESPDDLSRGLDPEGSKEDRDGGHISKLWSTGSQT